MPFSPFHPIFSSLRASFHCIFDFLRALLPLLSAGLSLAMAFAAFCRDFASFEILLPVFAIFITLSVIAYFQRHYIDFCHPSVSVFDDIFARLFSLDLRLLHHYFRFRLITYFDADCPRLLSLMPLAPAAFFAHVCRQICLSASWKGSCCTAFQAALRRCPLKMSGCHASAEATPARLVCHRPVFVLIFDIACHTDNPDAGACALHMILALAIVAGVVLSLRHCAATLRRRCRAAPAAALPYAPLACLAGFQPKMSCQATLKPLLPLYVTPFAAVCF